MSEVKFYTAKEVATDLKMHEVTIRQWIAEGKIKSIKVGRSRRIPAAEYQRLIAGDK